MFSKHYAVRNKARVFKLFNRGKRPCDIADAPVARRTLYQYFGEWRQEKGIAGRKTGFAVKPFNRKSYLEAKNREQLKKEKDQLERWATDYTIVLRELKQWAEELKEKETQPPRIYLPNKKQLAWLNIRLRYNKGEPGPLKSYQARLPIIQRNITWLEKWLELAGRASSLAEFKKLSREEAGGFPPELEDY